MILKYILSIFFIGILLTGFSLSGQGISPSLQGLAKLKSSSPFYYSKGYESRAAAIQEFFSEAIAFYKAEYPDISDGVDILILDKEDWVERYPAIPYGIPFFDENKSLVIPADKFTASMELGYDDLSTDQEISDYDKFIICTLGQSYILKTRSLKIPDIWMRDFLCAYLAVSFFEVNDFMWDLNPGNSEDITHRSLSAYNMMHQDLPAANYYWYQARFIELSRALFNNGGFRLLTELFNYFQKTGSIEGAEEIINTYGEKEYLDWKEKMK